MTKRFTQVFREIFLQRDRTTALQSTAPMSHPIARTAR